MMAAHDTLKDILELEELKKDTAVTRSVRASTPRLLTLNQAEKVHMEGLVTKLRKAYSGMLQSVQHCRLVATRREKLWVLFHRFSLENGIDMCNTCDLALNLSAPETFWQLLMLSEQEKCGVSTSAQMSADSTYDRRLTFVEENAVRYTAGYVIR